MLAYDDDNLFNKILKGDIPCHKIFETDHALAILDAFPLAPGHALLLPKAKCVSVLDMPAEVASAFLAELPRLARLVQRATGAPACNILQNSGKEAGQVVFHCHFHVIPRFENDDQAVKLKPPMSKEMLKAEDAKSMLAKMSETTLPYEASLGLLDQLVNAIAAGALTPPLPPTAPKGSASKAKAPASSPAPAPAPAPAAPPKLKEKPMAEAAAGGGGSGAADSGGGEKKPKADPRKKEVAPVADSGAEVGDVVDISWADIRVGKIVDAVPHPESDKLYVETIDLGDESPRQILSASDNLPECMLIASLIR
jgi:diadenosine tetraphosphate (Ap4A) HIT family hydrolase|eukprot:jgi/Chrpa1/5889/Chrysochromulina_OHIO_Genome00009848-RA